MIGVGRGGNKMCNRSLCVVVVCGYWLCANHRRMGVVNANAIIGVYTANAVATL